MNSTKYRPVDLRGTRWQEVYDKEDLAKEILALRSRLAEADERHSRYVKAVGELAGMAAEMAEAEALLREARDEQDACISPGWKARIDAHLARKP